MKKATIQEIKLENPTYFLEPRTAQKSIKFAPSLIKAIEDKLDFKIIKPSSGWGVTEYDLKFSAKVSAILEFVLNYKQSEELTQLRAYVKDLEAQIVTTVAEAKQVNQKFKQITDDIVRKRKARGEAN